MPQSQQHGVRAVSVTYTTARGNAGSLAYQVRLGIKPKTSWFLVRFVNHYATRGTPSVKFLVCAFPDHETLMDQRESLYPL